MQTITQINNDIDAAITDLPPKNITTASMRAILKKITTFLNDIVTNRISPWLSVSTGLPSLDSQEAIKRTGTVTTYGGIYARGSDGGTTLATTGFGLAPVQVIGQASGRPSYMEFHVEGIVIHQLGVDTDAVLKFRPYAQPNVYAVLVDKLNASLSLASTIANRKLVMYAVADNDHQFYGFGVNGNVCRYQVPTTADAHVFYAGVTAATSQELMRINGSGNMAIGDPTANFRLKVIDNNPANGWVAVLGNSRATAGRLGAKLAFDQSGLSTWNIGQPSGDVDAFVIEGNGYTERLRINGSGYIGINTNAPTSFLDVKGINGYTQFRLETDYTPTSSADPNGAIGQVCFDANYCYKKSAAGWKRSPIFTTF